MFGLNTVKYGVSLHIQSKCGKIRARKTPNTDTFDAVEFAWKRIIVKMNHYSLYYLAQITFCMCFWIYYFYLICWHVFWSIFKLTGIFKGNRKNRNFMGHSSKKWTYCKSQCPQTTQPLSDSNHPLPFYNLNTRLWTCHSFVSWKIVTLSNDTWHLWGSIFQQTLLVNPVKNILLYYTEWM